MDATRQIGFRHITASQGEQLDGLASYARIWNRAVAVIFNYFPRFVAFLTIENRIPAQKIEHRNVQHAPAIITQERTREESDLATYFMDKLSYQDLIQNRQTEYTTSLRNVISEFHVVALRDFPDIVLKITENEEATTNRIANHAEAKKIINEQHLDKLVIPHAVMREIKFKGVAQPIKAVLEEKLDIVKGSLETILKAFDNNSESLEGSVEQLTKLICLMDLGDIKPQNIPLIRNPKNSKWTFALVDIDQAVRGEELEGITAEFDGVGEPAYGLLRYFPQYEEQIAAVIKKTLPSTHYSRVEPALHKALARAKAINMREQNIQSFHRQRGITAESAAIPTALTDEIIQHVRHLKTAPDESSIYKENMPTDDFIRHIISDINAVIAKQCKEYTRLSHAREWRFTLDRYSKDSNKNTHIYNHSSFISWILLPFLKDKGVVHSCLERDKAKDLDVHVLRKVNLNGFDEIVQF